jgi:carbamoylphosphate synthase small subunit
MRKAPRTVKVKGHNRGKNERVKPHKRSKPDGIESNNHSYKK